LQLRVFALLLNNGNQAWQTQQASHQLSIGDQTRSAAMQLKQVRTPLLAENEFWLPQHVHNMAFRQCPLSHHVRRPPSLPLPADQPNTGAVQPVHRAGTIGSGVLGTSEQPSSAGLKPRVYGADKFEVRMSGRKKRWRQLKLTLASACPALAND
jgi:hypothetical protein